MASANNLQVTKQLRKMASKSAHALIDIGANLTDPVFSGNYRGKQRHQVDGAAFPAI